MDAWLLTWIILPTSKMDVDQVTAILSSRKSENTVAEAVELLYLRSMYSAYDMAYYANRRKKTIFKAQRTGGHVICGTNPYWLHARIVTNLRIQVDEKNGKEILTWKEPPTYKFSNYEIDEIIEGEERYYERRYLSPLSKDVWREARFW